jgi:hypothetical protein
VCLRGPKRLRLQNDGGNERSLKEVHSSSTSVEPSRNGTSDILTDVDYSNRPRIPTSSFGSFSSKGQLRISDLVEDQNSRDEGLPPTRHVQSHIPPSSTPDNATYRRDLRNHNADIRSSTEEENIPSLERKLGALRQYADDLLELSLVDSHAKILDKISHLEAQIEQKKRQKAEILFNSLNRDFPDLADIAMEEARRRGI